MSRTGRHRDDGAPLWALAETEVLVVCPRCAARAVVRAATDPPGGRRLTCSGCALAATTDARSSTWGAPVDPWFGQPLWLRAEFRGHTVWALGAEHLRRLRAHVAAGQRERRPVRGAPASMLEELPAWLTSAKNREALLPVLDRLAARL